jgi:hypothetical protein
MNDISIRKVHAALKKAGFKRSERVVQQYRYNGPKFSRMTNGYEATATKTGTPRVTVTYRASSANGFDAKMSEMLTVLQARFGKTHADIYINSTLGTAYIIVQ